MRKAVRIWKSLRGLFGIDRFAESAVCRQWSGTHEAIFSGWIFLEYLLQ